MAVSQGLVRGVSRIGFIALILALCIALNVGAGLIGPPGALVSAYQSGAVAGRTPPEVSDWWHVTRAQADCRSIEPSFGTEGKRADAAVSRHYLSDHGGKSTDCELVGGYLVDPANARIGHGMQMSGLSSGGAIAVLLIATLGWKGAQVAHLVLILAGWLATVFFWRRKALTVRHIAPSTALTLMLLLFGIPGSISLFPISALLLLMAASPVARVDPVWWKEHAGTVAVVSAAMFWGLDAQAGSVMAGLALLLGILPLCLGDTRLATLVRTGVTYLGTTMGIMVLYSIAAVLMAGARNVPFLKALRQAFGDISQAGPWMSEFPAALANVQDWLAAGILHSDLVVMLVAWTLPFAMLLAPSGKFGDGEEQPRPLHLAIVAWLPIVPCLLWMMAYPGLLRRSADNYALLIAVPLAVALWRAIMAASSVLHRPSALVPESDRSGDLLEVA